MLWHAPIITVFHPKPFKGRKDGGGGGGGGGAASPTLTARHADHSSNHSSSCVSLHLGLNILRGLGVPVDQVCPMRRQHGRSIFEGLVAALVDEILVSYRDWLQLVVTTMHRMPSTLVAASS